MQRAGSVGVACGSGRAEPTGRLQVRVLFREPSDGGRLDSLIQRAHGGTAGRGQEVTPMGRPPHVGLLLAHGHEALTPQPQSREDEQGPRGLNHHPAGPSQREHGPCPGETWAWRERQQARADGVNVGRGQTAPERASGPRAGEALLTEAGNRREPGASFPGDGTVSNPKCLGLLLHQLSSVSARWSVSCLS